MTAILIRSGNVSKKENNNSPKREVVPGLQVPCMGSLAERMGRGTDNMETPVVAARQHRLWLRCDGTCETFEIPETEGVRQALPGEAEAQCDAWA